MAGEKWEKQDWETARAYAAFSEYRDCGYGDRGEHKARPSVQKFARTYNYRAGIIAWAAGYDRNRQKKPGYSWEDRIAAYDDHLEARDRERREQEILEERARLRKIAWQRASLGVENVGDAVKGLRQMMGLASKSDLPTSQTFKDLPARDRKAILDALGRLAQHELDRGEAAARADVDMVTEKTKTETDVHVDTEKAAAAEFIADLTGVLDAEEESTDDAGRATE